MRERLVRVVAGHASDARVAFGPAAAVFQAIRSKANVEDASAHHLARDYVLPSAMAGTAKIDVVDASELGGIEH